MSASRRRLLQRTVADPAPRRSILDPCAMRPRYVLPAVEETCKRVGVARTRIDSRPVAAAGNAPSPAAPVLFLKHCLRDEYDDATDIARLYRLKVRA